MLMLYYFIHFRSLTYAQRGKRILERAGISGRIVRTPQSIARSGCGHSIKLSERWFEPALAALRRENISIVGIHGWTDQGQYREVVG